MTACCQGKRRPKISLMEEDSWMSQGLRRQQGPIEREPLTISVDKTKNVILINQIKQVIIFWFIYFVNFSND